MKSPTPYAKTELTILVGILAIGLVIYFAISLLSSPERPATSLSPKETLTAHVSAAGIESPEPSQPKETPPVSTQHHVPYVIASGETFNGILQRATGLHHEITGAITKDVTEVFNVTNIRADQTIDFYFTDDTFTHATYDMNSDETLRIVFESDDVFTVTTEPITYTTTEASTDVTITNSLYADGIEAGLTDKAIIELAKIFAWDIDFSTSIQKDDNFSMIYENRYRDDKFVGIGDILAARFTNNGETYYAFLVEDGNIKKYFNENGFTKELPFLKSPLNFSRISSKFTYRRKHPITGQVRPHTGVDLAAPTGTPIESVADGIVSSATTLNGYGKYIKIKHRSGYDTAYAHLSKISVRQGQRVSQGEVIGLVGSTGLSTGPHLHYEMHKDGVPLDPFSVKIEPSTKIDSALVPLFEEAKDAYFDRLSS